MERAGAEALPWVAVVVRHRLPVIMLRMTHESNKDDMLH